MAYTKTNWQDLPSTTTPITATRLNNIETGIKTNDDKLLGNATMGNIVVDSIRSKNVFVPSLASGGVLTTTAHCTATLNGDEFSLKATASDYCYFGEIHSAGQSYNSNRGQLIPVQEGEKLSFTLTNSAFNQNYMTFYNSSKTAISYVGWNTNVVSGITPPSNTAYVSFRFGVGSVSSGTTYSTKVQIEKNAAASTYSPYQNLTSISNIYNLGEQLIGEWIGKPLYRKVINFGTLPNATTKNVSTGLTNVVYVNIYGYATDGTYYWSLNAPRPVAGNNYGIGCYINNNNITIECGTDKSSNSAYVVIEYTKN